MAKPSGLSPGSGDRKIDGRKSYAPGANTDSQRRMDPALEREYLAIDPDLRIDRLPQPYRVVSNVLNAVLDDVGDEIYNIEQRRQSEEFEYHVKAGPAPDVTRIPEKVACIGQDRGNTRTVFLGFDSGLLIAVNLADACGAMSEFTPFEPAAGAEELEPEARPAAEPVCGIAASSRATYVSFDVLKPAPAPPPTSVLVWSEKSARTFTFERRNNVGELQPTCKIEVPGLVDREEDAEGNETQAAVDIAGGAVLGAQGLNWVVLLTDKVYVFACPLPLPPPPAKDRPLEDVIEEEEAEEEEKEAEERAATPPAEVPAVTTPLFAIDFDMVSPPVPTLVEVFTASTALVLHHPDSSLLRLYELLPSALSWPNDVPAGGALKELLGREPCAPGAVRQPEETQEIACRRQWDLPSFPCVVAAAPGARTFSVGCHDGTIVVFSSSTLVMQRICDGHYDAVVALSFSRYKEAAQSYLCSWSLDGFMHIYSLVTGEILFRSRLVKPADICPIAAGVCGPQNVPLGFGVDDAGQLRVFDVAAQMKVAHLKGPAGWKPVRVIAGRHAVMVLAEPADARPAAVAEAAAEEAAGVGSAATAEAAGTMQARRGSDVRYTTGVWVFGYAKLLHHLYPRASDRVPERKALEAEALYSAVTAGDRAGRQDAAEDAKPVTQEDPRPQKLTAEALESQRRLLAEEEGAESEVAEPEWRAHKEWFEPASWQTGVHMQMKAIIGDRNARTARIARRLEAYLSADK